LAQQGHHVDLEVMAPLRIQNDEEISTFPGGRFGSADDLGEEWDGKVGNDNAERVGAICFQASCNEIGLIFQDADCI